MFTHNIGPEIPTSDDRNERTVLMDDEEQKDEPEVIFTRTFDNPEKDWIDYSVFESKEENPVTISVILDLINYFFEEKCAQSGVTGIVHMMEANGVVGLYFGNQQLHSYCRIPDEYKNLYSNTVKINFREFLNTLRPGTNPISFLGACLVLNKVLVALAQKFGPDNEFANKFINSFSLPTLFAIAIGITEDLLEDVPLANKSLAKATHVLLPGESKSTGISVNEFTELQLHIFTELLDANLYFLTPENMQINFAELLAQWELRKEMLYRSGIKTSNHTYLSLLGFCSEWKEKNRQSKLVENEVLPVFKVLPR